MAQAKCCLWADLVPGSNKKRDDRQEGKPAGGIRNAPARFVQPNGTSIDSFRSVPPHPLMAGYGAGAERGWLSPWDARQPKRFLLLSTSPLVGQAAGPDRGWLAPFGAPG